MGWIKDFDNIFLSNKIYFKFERYKIYYRKLIENSQWLNWTKIEEMIVHNKQKMKVEKVV